MLRTSILVALRQLLKRPSSILLNIVGLSVGIITFGLLILYVQKETSYDTYHEDADQIYRIVNNFKADDEYKGSAWTSPALLHYANGNLPEILHGVRLFRYRSPSVFMDKTTSKSFSEEYSVWADPEIFEVFHFDFLAGDPKIALSRPNMIVITASAATRYFGDENPIGKVLSDLTMRADFEITAVVKDMPATSHFRADFISSLSTLPTVWNPTIMTDWGNSFLYSYIKTNGTTPLAELNTKLNENVKAYLPEESARESFFSLQPLTEIHLKSHLQNEWQPNSDIRYIQILLLVGILIMVVATINYINLWIARSLQRVREIGIRKAIGSSKLQLTRHFMVDNFIQVILAFIFSTFIISLFNQPIVSFLGSTLPWDSLSSWSVLLKVGAGIALFTMVTMLYPALLVSRMNVMQAIKGKATKLGKGVSVWKGLVAFQVLVTTMLITSAILISQQLDFVQSRPVGYEANQIINIAQASDNQLRNRLKDELLQNTLVNSATGVSHQIGGILYRSRYELQQGDNPAPVVWQRLHTDHDFLRTYGIPLLAGRDFSTLIASDTSNYLVNEAACRDAGMGVEEAIGMDIRAENNAQGKIIGVFKDFHFKTLHSAIEPLIVHIVPDRVRMLSVNIQSSHFQETIASMEASWKQLSPEVPFTYTSLGDFNARNYEQEEKFNQLIMLFTIIVICLSVTGLISLNLYVVNLKRKEIGIRKVHGAGVRSVLLHISKGFAHISVVSFVLSIPISWYLLDSWLSLFAYRVDITIWLFLAAGAISFVISMLSIALPSLKAVTENTVHILNTE